jgi:hypothetical protein
VFGGVISNGSVNINSIGVGVGGAVVVASVVEGIDVAGDVVDGSPVDGAVVPEMERETSHEVIMSSTNRVLNSRLVKIFNRINSFSMIITSRLKVHGVNTNNRNKSYGLSVPADINCAISNMN